MHNTLEEIATHIRILELLNLELPVGTKSFLKDETYKRPSSP